MVPGAEAALAQEVLDQLRPLVIVVDGLGVVRSIHGGFGGFLGFDLPSMVGESVFDHVVPSNADDLLTYFAESAGEAMETVALPMSFRMQLIGGDSLVHAVDVIPSGRPDGHGEVIWTVVLIPVRMHASVSLSLDAELAGASRAEVRELLTAELVEENRDFSTRCFLVDLRPSVPEVVAHRDDSRAMVSALTSAIGNGWSPWVGASALVTAPLLPDDLPERVASIASSYDWRRVSYTPVYLKDELVAAYLLFSRVVDEYPVDSVKSNVANRVSNLVDVTALLFGRWRDEDRLAIAATTDHLTGLANRAGFAAAVENLQTSAAVLYLDVDDFKAINDELGHDAGDEALRFVANTIIATCRPGDLVARLGGDEFVALLPDIDAATARRISERIVGEIAQPIQLGGHQRTISVSVGLASADRNNVSAAVSQADRAMFEAKRGGRSLRASKPPST